MAKEKAVLEEEICRPATATSSTWEGFYSHGGSNHHMSCSFTFYPEGTISGAGTDDVGAFTWSGQYGGKKMQVIKQYHGKHSVTYSGTLVKQNSKVVFYGNWVWPQSMGGDSDFFRLTEQASGGSGGQIRMVRTLSLGSKAHSEAEAKAIAAVQHKASEDAASPPPKAPPMPPAVRQALSRATGIPLGLSPAFYAQQAAKSATGLHMALNPSSALWPEHIAASLVHVAPGSSSVPHRAGAPARDALRVSRTALQAARTPQLPTRPLAPAPPNTARSHRPHTAPRPKRRRAVRSAGSKRQAHTSKPAPVEESEGRKLRRQVLVVILCASQLVAAARPVGDLLAVR